MTFMALWIHQLRVVRVAGTFIPPLDHHTHLRAEDYSPGLGGPKGGSSAFFVPRAPTPCGTNSA
jgi:hypothetical protein